jgi:heme A synthase
VTGIHEAVGFVVIGIFTIGWVFGLVLWVSRRAAGTWFWRWLTAAQVIAILQAVIGVILVISGKRPTTWLHYVYGFGPLVIFAIGHALARDVMFRSKPWAPFAMASFISFGLSLRALMTGLGLG